MNLLEGEDQKPDEREELLNKWKDKPLEEVLKAKVESDLYIKTLEKQKDELREDYLKQREELLAKAKFEELIDRYEKAPKEKAPKESQVANPANDESSPVFDPKEVEKIVAKKLRETKAQEEQQKNFNEVQNKLKERYGEGYRTVVKEQQSTLGLSDDDINSLAKRSPQALIKLFGADQPRNDPSFQTPPRSGQRNDNFAPKGPAKRDYAFYQEMKKTNPKAYLDPKIAVQMHNDVIQMGEAAFYGQN